MPSLNSSNDLTIGVNTTADTKGVEQTEDAIKGLSDTTGDASKAADSFGKEFSDGMKKVSVATGIAAAAVTLYAKSATDTVVDMAKGAKQLSRETGTSEVEASKLLAVTQRLGIDTEQASSSFGIFSKKIVESNDKSSEAAQTQADLTNKIAGARIEITKTAEEIRLHGDKTGELRNKVDGLNLSIAGYAKKLTEAEDPLKKLNVETKNADGTTRGFQDILLDVADRFKAMPDGVDKTASSMELFGRSGKDMIKVLNLGSDGIKDLEKQADKLGLTLTKDNIGAVNEYIQSQRKLKDVTDSLKISVGNLTAPVLTKFNTEVAGVAQRLLEASGPMKDVIANVLAFGGPVLGATSAITGFAANLTTAIGSAGGMQAAVSSLGMALTGPVGLSIALATVAVAGLTFAYMTHKTAAEELKIATDNLNVSQQAIATAQDNVKAKTLDLEGANLRVETAQNNYNEAVKRYGPASLEARQANYDLQTAILAKKDAETQSQDALEKMKQAEQKYAQDKSFQLAIAEKKDEVKGLQGLINSLEQDISKATTSGGQKLDGSTGTLQNLRNAFSHRAKGGPVSAGTPYAVGDNPDGSWNKTTEVFVPNQSGTIISADAVQKAGGGGVQFNQTNHIYNSADIEQANQQLAWRFARA